MVTSEFEIVVGEMQQRQFAIRRLLNALETLTIGGKLTIFSDSVRELISCCGKNATISKLSDAFCEMWIQQRNNETILWVIEAALSLSDRNLATSIAESAANVLSELSETNENKHRFINEYLPKHLHRKCKLGIECPLHKFASDVDVMFDFDLVRVPAFPGNLYQHRPDDENRVMDAVLDVCYNPGPRVVVIAGEAGVGKTTLTANLFHSKRFKAPKAVTVVFWLGCYKYGTESAELDVTSKTTFNDELIQLAKLADPEFPDERLTYASHIVPYFHSKARRCLFFFDDVFNEKLLKYFFSIQKDARHLLCCAVTRNPLPLKVSQDWATVVSISYLDDKGISDMFHGVYSLPNCGISEHKISVLVLKCCGLPLIANLIWAWFKNANDVDEAYERLIDNLKNLDDHIKKDIRKFKTVSQLFELSVNQLKNRQKLLYFYLLFFDPGEAVENVDLEIFWRLAPSYVRLTIGLFVDKCLARQDSYSSSIFVHQMMWEAACNLAFRDFTLLGKAAIGKKLALEELRMKLVTGLSENDREKEMIAFEMVRRQRRNLLRHVIARLNAEDLAHLAVKHSKQLDGSGKWFRTFIHFLYRMIDWPDSTVAKNDVRFSVNVSYRLIRDVLLKIRKKGPLLFSKVAKSTSVSKLATEQVDAFLIDLYSDLQNQKHFDDRRSLVVWLLPWFYWYNDQEWRNSVLRNETSDSNCLVLALIRNKPLNEIHFSGLDLTKQLEGIVAAARCNRSDILTELLKQVAVPSLQSLWSALVSAVENAHLDIVRCLVEQHRELLTTTDNDGYTVLHIAARNDNLEIVRFLFAQNAELMKKTAKNGSPAIHFAAAAGHLDIVQWFIEECRDLLTITNIDGYTAMHVAARNDHCGVVSWLIQQTPGWFTLTTTGGDTLLHLAARGGHLEMVRLLIKQHQELLTMKDNTGWTALHFAAAYGHLDIVRCLIEEHRDLITMTCSKGWTVLYLAAALGHLDVVRFLNEECGELIKIPAKDGRTSLHQAAAKGHLAVVHYLIDQCGELIAMTDNNGRTALHCAAENDYLDIARCMTAQHQDLITMTTKMGWTVLHSAASNGNVEIIRYLVEQHCELVVSLVTESGETPLHLAAQNGHLSAVRYLAEKVPELINIRDNIGRTPAVFAEENDHYDVICYLLDDRHLV